jgi:hypothetical protein
VARLRQRQYAQLEEFRNNLADHSLGMIELKQKECAFCDGVVDILLALADWTWMDMIVRATVRMGDHG